MQVQLTRPWWGPPPGPQTAACTVSHVGEAELSEVSSYKGTNAVG